MHDIWLDQPDLRIRNAQRQRRHTTHIVYYHICVLDQSSQYILARRLLQIQGHTALVAIEVGKASTNVGTRPGAHRAKTVTVQRFYFRDLGAKVAEKLGGIRSQYHRREIHNFDAF